MGLAPGFVNYNLEICFAAHIQYNFHFDHICQNPTMYEAGYCCKCATPAIKAMDKSLTLDLQ